MKLPSTPSFLAALVLVSVICGSFGPVPNTVGTATAAEDDGGSASFIDRNVTVTRGDTLELAVSHSGPATVYLGSERKGFLLEVHLPGSGTDTIDLDTYDLSGPPYVEGGDATLHTDPLGDPLVPGRYLMNVTVGGVERDLGSFVVRTRDSAQATTFVGPASLDADAELGELTSQVTRRNTVARGDYALVRLDESGLENALNESDLSGGAAAEGVHITLSVADPPQNREADSFVVTDSADVTVRPDFENDAVYLLWDTANATLYGEPAATYELVAELNATHSGLVTRDETLASAEVTVQDPAIALSSESGFTLSPWENTNVNVNGETNLAPGTTLDVRARTIDPDVHLSVRAVTVGEDGTFATAFDFGSLSKGTKLPLWVLGYRDETEKTVELLDERADLTLSDQTTRGRAVALDSVSLSVGGYVQLQNDERGVLGTTDYLAAGRHEDVSVRIGPPLNASTSVTAVAYMDRNGNREFDGDVDDLYAPDGQLASATANVTVLRAPTPTPRPETATAAPTATPTAVPTTPEARTPTARAEATLTPVTKTQGDVPLAVPIVALLVVAVGAGLFVRRR